MEVNLLKSPEQVDYTTLCSPSPTATTTMDGSQEPQANIMDWDEHDVHLFLSRLGFPQYEAQLVGEWAANIVRVRFTWPSNAEHGITGDILSQLDADYLKEIGVQTIGQRLAILKGV